MNEWTNENQMEVDLVRKSNQTVTILQRIMYLVSNT